jgi:hypothetical protein
LIEQAERCIEGEEAEDEEEEVADKGMEALDEEAASNVDEEIEEGEVG